MSYDYGGFAPYVSVAERRRKAERLVKTLSKAGKKLAPVSIAGRAIATSFWGRAWCDNMESYHDYENRLPRGRSYVRNGSVIDLQIAPGKVTALVSGSSVYTVGITIKQAAVAHWRAICADCAGSIDSLMELLQGRVSKKVMERLSRQDNGLFPRPAEIRFSCSCPDGAAMCKHVAAALYGVGVRLDEQPELLFRLRAVNEADLIGSIDAAVDLGRHPRGAARVLDVDDVSALFGLDMADGPVADTAHEAEAAGAKRAAAAGKPGAAASGEAAKNAAAKNTAAKNTAAKNTAAKNTAAKKAGAKKAGAKAESAGKAAMKIAPTHKAGANTAGANKVGRGQGAANTKVPRPAAASLIAAKPPKQPKAVAKRTVADKPKDPADNPARWAASGPSKTASKTSVLMKSIRASAKPAPSAARKSAR